MDNEVIIPEVVPTMKVKRSRRGNSAALAGPVSPMTLLSIAVSQGADLDRLERLMDMQQRYEAMESIKAFNQAFSAFKAESVSIVKNVTITDGPLKGKKYADLFCVVAAVTPALSKHGLSISWRLTKDEPTWIEVTATLRHISGHKEEVAMGGAPDTGAAKNAIMARASSISYLERYTMLAITGLSASDIDNDGATVTDKELESLTSAKTMEELTTEFEVLYRAATTAKDREAQARIIAAKNKRKAELEVPV